METPNSEPEVEAPSAQGRARRAFAIIAASVAVITLTGVAYLHPSLPVTTAP